MSRRKKANGAEALMALIAMLPWRAGEALAVVFHVVLHRAAAQRVAGSLWAVDPALVLPGRRNVCDRLAVSLGFALPQSSQNLAPVEGLR